MAEIVVREARKSFGRQEVIRGVDLTIADREFVVVLGPSGCGKSTLLRMIAGLEQITAGVISIGGRVVNRLEPRERGCAMVFQNYALYPHMSVAGNIGYALKVAGVPRAERETRVRDVARTVGLEELLDRRPAELSGGQRQRVAMGRAMVRRPKVFLFDEPLSNLDAKLRMQMRVELRKLHARLGATSVFVTHDQTEAMTLADRIVVMNQGLIEQVGAPLAIYRRPASRFVAGFIGSPPMNLLEGRLRGGRLQLAAGPDLDAPAGAPDGEVTVGFRPEAAVLVEPGSPGALPVEVEMIEELGVGRIAHARLADVPLALMTNATSLPGPGGRLGLRLPPAELHLFDRETGFRLEPRASPSLAAA